MTLNVRKSYWFKTIVIRVLKILEDEMRLQKLFVVMQHHFFMDLAAQLPPDFTANAPDPTLSLQERIAVLEEEDKVLKTKVETLMAVMWK